jgi:hypothetical protein
MWAQVWDGHLKSQKNPERLKRSIHVDCIRIYSTFVYIYAGLRVLMIWANCLGFFSHIFSFEKSRRCDNNQQTTITHFVEYKRLHLESSKQNFYIISFMSNNKSNLHFTSFLFMSDNKRNLHFARIRIDLSSRVLGFCWNRTNDPRIESY